MASANPDPGHADGILHFLRKHWYDLGGMLAIVLVAGVLLCRYSLSTYQLLLWLSLASLLHQFEEYRFPGTFPGMINRVMYRSKQPDRYPLNTRTAFLINVGVGWTIYLLAAVVAERAIWLGMATILVSVGNVVAHTVLFNIRGRTIYNAGLLTSLMLFVPCAYGFFRIIDTEHLVAPIDYLIGIPLGLAANVVGILKMIDWLADEHTAYVFDRRNLLPADREQKLNP